MYTKRSVTSLAAVVFSATFALSTTNAHAWDRGLNAGSWTKGATLMVFVDSIPGDAPEGTDAAIDEAIKEWNVAQADFGGLKLVRTDATKDNADIHISWNKNARGSQTNKKDDFDKKNNGFAKETVRMEMSLDSVNARGVTRDLKHEFGHAEGLAHSAKSALMKEDAYSSTPRKGPSIADLNRANPFIEPTDDDKAGKKSLWGTKEKLSRSENPSTVTFDGTKFIYDYSIHALDLPGLIDPVTELSINMLPGIGLDDFSITGIPTGWHFFFYDGTIEAGGRSDDNELSSPSLLSFLADSSSFGIFPGNTADFQLTSLFGPGTTRAFTNSPNYDSDEFVKLAPSRVPEPSIIFLMLAGSIGLIGRRLRYSRV
jgi:hypothetical protein